MKLIIIDGNSLINRAFYGVPMLSNSKGVITNGVYGFLNMMLNLLKQEEPDFLAVAFDVSKKVFRHEMYEDYKGTRKGMPDELRMQMPLLKEMLEAMNIKILEAEGFEADDIIGTVTNWASKENIDSIIVTGDKDSLQLIDPCTRVYMTKKGISQIEIFDEAHLKEVYDLTPAQICDLKGLMGDSSDNIPGVAGVGEKTALKLLKDYGTIEELYLHLDDFNGKKLGEKLAQNEEMAYLSKKLATIATDIPIAVTKSDLLRKEADLDKVLALCKELELNTLQKYFMQEQVQKDDFQKQEIPGVELDDKEELEHLLKEEAEWLTVMFFGEKMGIYLNDTAYILNFSPQEALAVLKNHHANIKIQTDDAKKLYQKFYQAQVAMDVQRDCALMAYLLEPEKDNETETLIYNELNLTVPKEGTEKLYALLYGVHQLNEVLYERIEKENLLSLYEKIERPLAKILTDMEQRGIKIDCAYLNALNEEFTERIDKIVTRVYDLAGEEFNLNSPKQLGVILFEKLHLPIIKKTKTGYSTSAEVLEELKDQHEIVQEILAYRQLAKLKSTYVDGLLNIKDEEDIVHTSFNQTITATGRLSSTEPNLQNIPVKTEEGRRIRKAFIPVQKENILIAADYSQIELRILAHMSEDSVLTESFRNNEDIHARTASEVFAVPMEEVTKEMRRNAKAVNFGIIYGQTDYGLSQELSIPRKEAKAYIDSYFARYSRVKEWIDDTVQRVSEEGYVKTMFERRRYIKDINSKNFNLRSFAARTAVNTPIQGSAADIIKLAMIEIDEKMRAHQFKAKMLLQVHDELIFEVPPNEAAKLILLIKKVMENVVELNVPLVVDVKAGFNWAEMEKV